MDVPSDTITQPPSAPTTQSHPWHGVVPILPNNIINALVEIPKGSRAKFEIDKVTGLIRMDRVLQSSMQYPVHYGIIPQSLCGDGDPLDILVICTEWVPPLTLIHARVVGVMPMTENGLQDDKIIAVAVADVKVNHIHALDALPAHFETEIQDFFNKYKTLEGSHIVTKAFEGIDTAWLIINDCMKQYQQKF